MGFPSPDVVWTAIFLAGLAVVGWGIAMVRGQQQIKDHIAECDKRQKFVEKELAEIKTMIIGRRWFK